ncbi:hypothetical protein ANN_05187 [Periplaneta americana]|uniref:E3 ubiquitin-protein ligase CHFR n=1 Tax=Periplaneta americana TaxID=6978 RepID=A0ABQ8TAF0_PERAM|nr:hypothetical protein ANN_05187 [Periplaneta americana]
MNASLVAVRSVPGISQVNHCCMFNEIETLPHVLSFCRKGELLRINHHNRVRSSVANCFRECNKFEVHEEIHCISNEGSTKRADIVVIDRQRSKRYRIDPMVHFEKGVTQSTFGTFLNKRKLEKDKPTTLKDGDQIEFSTYNFTFYTKDTYSPCNKKMRLDIKVDIDTNRNMGQKTAQKIDLEEDRLQDSGSTTVQKAEERRMSQNTLLKEKQVLEEKLKEMQNLLEEKDKAQEMLNKKLQQKEEERLRDLNGEKYAWWPKRKRESVFSNVNDFVYEWFKCARAKKLPASGPLIQEKALEIAKELNKELQEQKDRQAEAMREALEKEVREKEEILRIQLAREIQSLQEEKLKIENNIRDEHSKIKGESAENLKRLKEELQKVKNDLSNVEGKKQYLEKELEETTKAKEEASESCLRAKQEILENFGELMETELQCGICNELFVTATTLNCTHTFCRSCILEWKKKKKECPICRARISSENRSLVVDNFIDRMVQNLSAEMQNRRQELVESRQSMYYLIYHIICCKKYFQCSCASDVLQYEQHDLYVTCFACEQQQEAMEGISSEEEEEKRADEFLTSNEIKEELLGPKEKPEPSRGPQRLRRRRGRHDLSQSSSEDASLYVATGSAMSGNVERKASTSLGIRRSYDASFKLAVIRHARSTSNREAGKKFSVDESNVRWMAVRTTYFGRRVMNKVTVMKQIPVPVVVKSAVTLENTVISCTGIFGDLPT